jgi:putative flippase GtrA
VRPFFEQALRFGAVGIVISVVALACIWAAMLLGVAPLPANALGFGIGLMVSFVLNRGGGPSPMLAGLRDRSP